MISTREATPWNVRLFLSFQSVQEMSSSKLSNAGRASLCHLNLGCNHHSPSSIGRSGTETKPTGSNSKYQSCLARTHPSRRCAMVSFSWPQSAHSSLSWRAWRFLRSVVHSRRCKAIQKKNFTFGGAPWSSRAPWLQTTTWNPRRKRDRWRTPSICRQATTSRRTCRRSQDPEPLDALAATH